MQDIDRTPRRVPFGYEPQAERRKGTLVVYDAFEDAGETAVMLERAARCADRLAFSALVLYPLHEETLRRMIRGASFEPFAGRAERLHDWKRALEPAAYDVAVDHWDGKRKKYTPIDAALRYLTESYRPPFFLFMSADNANRFASYDSFETWIAKLRLLLGSRPDELHPLLDRYRARWETVAETLESQGLQAP